MFSGTPGELNIYFVYFNCILFKNPKQLWIYKLIASKNNTVFISGDGGMWG
jgi:hypothetical protein